MQLQARRDSSSSSAKQKERGQNEQLRHLFETPVRVRTILCDRIAQRRVVRLFVGRKWKRVICTARVSSIAAKHGELLCACVQVDLPAVTQKLLALLLSDIHVDAHFVQVRSRPRRPFCFKKIHYCYRRASFIRGFFSASVLSDDRTILLWEAYLVSPYGQTTQEGNSNEVIRSENRVQSYRFHKNQDSLEMCIVLLMDKILLVLGVSIGHEFVCVYPLQTRVRSSNEQEHPVCGQLDG